MHIAHFISALPYRFLPLLVVLVGLESQALTLGRVQGAALIGRTLDVLVQVQLDADQNVTSACFAADVFHADTRQNPDGVRVRLEPAASGQGAQLRITSDSRIDEPIVTVYVRAGCAQITTRRYVLLADIVSEQAPMPVPRVGAMPLVDTSAPTAAGIGSVTGDQSSMAPSAAGASSSQSAGAAAARAAPAARKPRVASAPARTKRVNALPPAAVKAAPAAPRPDAQRPAARGGTGPVAASAPSRGTGQSRLKLDPLETLTERVATLESSAPAAPTETSEREVRELQRLESLETSVKSLLALAQKNEASLRDIRARLQQAQPDRFSNPAIYSLLGLLLLALLAIAYLLTRVNRRPEEPDSLWLSSAQEADAGPFAAPVARNDIAAPPDSALSALSTPAPLSRPAPMQRTDRIPIEPTQPMPHDIGTRGAGAASARVDVTLVEMSESTFDRLMQSSATHNAVRQARDTVPMAVAKGARASATMPLARRSRIDADELIDVRQRAEFFVSLGQTDQAVQVLETRIAQDGVSSPQAYLDLLRLFQSLGLKADFNQVRDDFCRTFNARVPEFAQFGVEGRVLEDYPGAVDRLIAAWNRSGVVETIEQMLFRSSPADGGPDTSFDLAAFRDLLLVHAVAQSVRGGAAGRTGAYPSSAIDIELSPQVDIDLFELFAPDSAPTQAMQRSDAGDTGTATVPATTATDNLIDFDLSDGAIGKTPGRGS